MKRLVATHPCVALLMAILDDSEIVCRASTYRDRLTILSRFEHEGLSFLTITLPAVAKSFEKALEAGRITSTQFAGFKAASGASLPAFLQGLTRQVFTPEGDLQDAPNVDAVEAIRQICLAFNKIRIECTIPRRRKAECQFIATDREVSRNRVTRTYTQLDTFSRVARLLLGNVLGHTADKLANLGLSLRHGPGSTVDRTLGNKKFTDRRWTTRLERTYLKADRYKYFNLNEVSDLSSELGLDIEFLPRKEEPPVRVVFVPKTMKTPRVIAIEPIWTQECQQGIARELIGHLETDPVTRGHVNFTDQTINRNLAFDSSLSRKYATIDLSEASDRVHPALVARLFQSQPELMKAVFACRSERAELPSGKVISLGKFASQGSALCFPVEAMVFYCIIVSAILKHRGLLLDYRNCRKVAADVFVYGDDLAVPTQEVDVVTEQLEAAGLKVNRGKTFSRGHFRESCGMDAFAGVNVTPVYIRHPLPDNIRDAESIAGTASTANQFYKKGYWKTCTFLRSFLEDVVGVVPHMPDNSPLVAWHSFQQWSTNQRWNTELCRFETRSIMLKPQKDKDPLDGYRALHKWSIARGGLLPLLGTPEPLDKDSFVNRVVRGKLKTTFRWAPAA